MKPMYVETQIHIKAYEIDAMGIVSNIVYIKWFEDLRHLLLDKYYPYEDMMEYQQSPILMKTQAEYKKSLTIMHKPTGRAWFSAMGATKWEITLEIMVGEELYCRGIQTGGFFDLNRNRPVAFPKWFSDVFTLAANGYDIYYPQDSDYDEITEIWEASVRETHTFLTENDITFFKPLVRNQALAAANLVCLKNEKGSIVGFMGMDNENLEMLFIHPGERGKGLGKFLLNYATGRYGITTVDVNEQNKQAVGFYLHQGFEVISRDETDSMGKPFPILHLKKL